VVKIDMTRQIKIDGDASMMTSWNGWLAHTMTHRALGLILWYMSNYE